MLQEFLEIEELKSIHEEKLRLMEREMALSTPLLTELEYIPILTVSANNLILLFSYYIGWRKNSKWCPGQAGKIIRF